MSYDDNPDWTKIWVAVVFTVGVIVISLIAAMWHYNVTIDKAAMESGLEQHSTDRGIVWAAKEKR